MSSENCLVVSDLGKGQGNEGWGAELCLWYISFWAPAHSVCGLCSFRAPVLRAWSHGVEAAYLRGFGCVWGANRCWVTSTALLLTDALRLNVQSCYSLGMPGNKLDRMELQNHNASSSAFARVMWSRYSLCRGFLFVPLWRAHCFFLLGPWLSPCNFCCVWLLWKFPTQEMASV